MMKTTGHKLKNSLYIRSLKFLTILTTLLKFRRKLKVLNFRIITEPTICLKKKMNWPLFQKSNRY
jgi:hypothetical protein